MCEFAQDTEVTFNGRPGRVEVAPLSIGGEGPQMLAVDLVGQDFYAWMLECPDVCHELLHKITRGMIRAEEHFRRIDPRFRCSYGIAEDSAQIASAEMFRQFCLPYDNMLYEAFGRGLGDGRGMHMCGESTHLHGALVENLRISSFNFFGCVVPPAVAAANMGSRVYLTGNVDPALMWNGSEAQTYAAAMHCLEELAPCGGFMLGDGANVCPGTPLENLAALTRASKAYGLPDERGK
jgi:uroporphyrinogen decarboxylase